MCGCFFQGLLHSDLSGLSRVSVAGLSHVGSCVYSLAYLKLKLCEELPSFKERDAVAARFLLFPTFSRLIVKLDLMHWVRDGAYRSLSILIKMKDPRNSMDGLVGILHKAQKSNLGWLMVAYRRTRN